MEIQAIAFDLDGTLCHTIPDLCATANAMREHFHLSALPQASIQSYIGDGIGELIHRVLTDQRDIEAAPEQWQEGLDFFTRYYAAHIADHSLPYPDCAATLKMLQQYGIALAVVTNKEEELARDLLEHFQLDKYFQSIIGGNSLSQRKPDPIMLTETAARLGIPVAKLLMVGDSVNDILVSKNAGCPSVLVSYGYGDVDTLQANPKTRADKVIDRLSELKNLV